jgi:Domain of unknown function (DUF2017)
VNVAPDVADLVVHLSGELRDVLTQADADDPALRRLFPAAYHNDAERDAEYQELMRGELTASRLTALARVIDVFTSSERILTRGDMELFLQTTNAVRLLLGTMLDVSEDDQEDTEDSDDPDDPDAAHQHLYAYLGWLLEAAVSALMATPE